MMDLNSLKTPKADNPVQVKYTLSSTAREKLRRAAAFSGQDMSTLLEILIRDHLPDPDAAVAPTAAPAPETQRPQRSNGGLDFDFDR